VTRWYDAVASPSHLFSRDHDHVVETSRADHYRAPCGKCRIAPLALPQSVGMTVAFRRTIKRETLLRCFHCQVSPAFELNRVAAFLFLRLALVNPPPSPTSAIASPTQRASCFTVFVDHLQKKFEEDREKNPSSIIGHASVRGDVGVSPLDACSDVPLHRRRSLSSFSFPCTHSSSSPA
jgi:hypothetical protein